MDLIAVGLNHQTAPIEVRERLAITESALPKALAALRSLGFQESAILSTCNRTEIYGIPSPGQSGETIKQFLSEHQSTGRAAQSNRPAVSQSSGEA